MADLRDLVLSSFLVMFLIVALLHLAWNVVQSCIAIWRKSLISSTLIAVASGMITLGIGLAMAIYSRRRFKHPFKISNLCGDSQYYELTTADRVVLYLVALYILVPVVFLYEPIVHDMRMMQSVPRLLIVKQPRQPESLVPKEIVPEGSKVPHEPNSVPTKDQAPSQPLPNTDSAKVPESLPVSSDKLTTDSSAQSSSPAAVPPSEQKSGDSEPPSVLPESDKAISESAAQNGSQSAPSPVQKPGDSKSLSGDSQGQRIRFKTPDGIVEGTVELHKYGSFLVILDGGGKKWILERDVVQP
ncbi:MAG: hypothetical protein HQL77_01180 [Magnetococcales bacterium]|nr:hypothetical protein [Magnetococcales bacterium]